MKTEGINGVFYCAVIISIGFILYSPVTGFDFVWDDYSFLKDNPYLSGSYSLADSFVNPEAFAVSREAQIYRPVRNMYWIVINGLAGMDPFWFHTAGIILHLINSCLVYLLFASLFKIKKITAFLFAVIFAVHPLGTEVVCWIKASDDLLAVLFGLLFIIFSEKYFKQKSLFYFFIAVVTYVSAIFSKESALFLIFVPFMISNNMKISENRGFLTALAVLTTGYLLLRTYTLGQLGQAGYLAGSFIKTQFGMGVVYLTGIIKMIMPLEQRVNYMGYSPFEEYSFAAIVVSWIFLTLFFLFLYFRYRGIRKYVLLFVFSVLPVSNIIPMMQWEAERFLYFPLVFFLLIMAYLLDNFSLNQPGGRTDNLKFKFLKIHLNSFPGIFSIIMTVSLVLYVCMLFFMNYERQKIWKNSRTLGLSMLESNPGSYHGLAMVLEYNKRYLNIDENIYLGKMYTAMFPDEEFIYHYFAFAYIQKSDFVNAENVIQTGLKRFPASELFPRFERYIQSGAS